MMHLRSSRLSIEQRIKQIHTYMDIRIPVKYTGHSTPTHPMAQLNINTHMQANDDTTVYPRSIYYDHGPLYEASTLTHLTHV